MELGEVRLGPPHGSCRLGSEFRVSEKQKVPESRTGANSDPRRRPRLKCMFFARHELIVY